MGMLCGGRGRCNAVEKLISSQSRLSSRIDAYCIRVQVALFWDCSLWLALPGEFSTDGEVLSAVKHECDCANSPKYSVFGGACEQNWYVAPWGSENDADGSQRRPLLTIQVLATCTDGASTVMILCSHCALLYPW